MTRAERRAIQFLLLAYDSRNHVLYLSSLLVRDGYLDAMARTLDESALQFAQSQNWLSQSASDAFRLTMDGIGCLEQVGALADDDFTPLGRRVFLASFLSRELTAGRIRIRRGLGIDDSFTLVGEARQKIERALEEWFSSDMAREFSQAHAVPDASEGKDAYDAWLKSACAYLDQLFIQTLESSREEVRSTKMTTQDSEFKDTVFIVHGHDDQAKLEVKNVIYQLELKPIVLHEQPNGGKTIIEKFEHHSDVGFAVILLTPDDFGYSANEDAANAKPRARQNVIMELGFFLCKVGRGKVCTLYKKGVDVPSDIQGVIYTPMDEHGAWKHELAREIKNAGFDVEVANVAS